MLIKARNAAPPETAMGPERTQMEYIMLQRVICQLCVVLITLHSSRLEQSISQHFLPRAPDRVAKMQLKHSVFLLQALPAAYAWSALGHETVAYIAQNLVSSATKTYLQTVLGDTSTSYLATISTWADTYRTTTAGAFSKPYHYIDAQDSPPSSCGVSYSRDCGTGGCVVSAIANYVSLGDG
jgi:hypothetical protein